MLSTKYFCGIFQKLGNFQLHPEESFNVLNFKTPGSTSIIN